MLTPLSILLKDKGYAIHHISKTASCHECALKLNQLGVGALLVMEGDKLEGIISERDFLRRLISKKADPASVSVAEIMTKDLITVPPTMSVQEAMRIITEKRLRHLPVIDNEKLIGLISIGDLTRWIMLQQESEISDLTEYIQGKHR